VEDGYSFEHDGKDYDSLHDFMKEESQIKLDSIARKEKNIIKAYMKFQYGDKNNNNYHQADFGELNEKKYLISAKWWR